MMTSTAMILAARHDLDIGQIIVVILFLLGGFVQWLIKWWKEKSPGSNPEIDIAEKIEELKARGKAWLKQTGQGETSESPPPVVPPVVMIGEAQLAGRKNAAPPPIPRQTPPGRNTMLSKPVPEPAPLRQRHPLISQIAGIGGLQRAIVLNEILGPPKALQNEPRQIN